MQIHPSLAQSLSAARSDDVRRLAARQAAQAEQAEQNEVAARARARGAVVRYLGETLVAVGLRLAGPQSGVAAPRLAGSPPCS